MLKGGFGPVLPGWLLVLLLVVVFGLMLLGVWFARRDLRRLREGGVDKSVDSLRPRGVVRVRRGTRGWRRSRVDFTED